MILHTNQPVWRYAYFQIPAILTVVFLIIALLTRSLDWFPPNVSVKVMLDLSSSTYGSVFRGSGTLMEAEILAIKEYASQNAKSPNPNLLSVSGFADQVIPITQNFLNNPAEIEQALDQVVQPSIVSLIGGGTNLDLAIEKGLITISDQVRRCKEILVVTDGQAQLRPDLVWQSINNGVRLNFLIVDQSVPVNLLDIAIQTGGLALPANLSNIKDLVSGEFRQKFNSNAKRVNFFLGLALISFIWMLVLPIDRLLRTFRKMAFNWSGKIALFNALFWTVLIISRVGFPFFSGC